VPHAVGVDVGSTNVKAALVADDGTLVGSGWRPLTTRRDGEVAEQDPEALWSAVVDAVAEATAADPAAGADVAAIGVCSQYSSIVPVDASGTPTAALVMYLDHRGTDHSWQIMSDHPEAFEVFLDHHGIPPVGGGISLAHLLHFQLDRPDVHAATSAYLEPMDFVNLRLTGRATANQGTMFMAQLCDNRTLGVTEYDPELLRLTGVDPATLPPLSGLTEAAGPLLAEVAGRMGVAAGATVHAAMNDSAAGAFATGAFTPGRGGLSIGTTAVLLAAKEGKDADLDHEVLSMPSPEPGRYLVWAENGIAGKAVEHVLEQVLGASFDDLEAALAASPPGSRGALFLPWLNGSLSPSAHGTTRGGFLNLSLDTGRPDAVRAMVEGTAHNLRWLLPYVEAFGGHAIDEIVFGGGAARSAGWCQVLADVLDRPVLPLADPDRAAARACALLALHREGVLSRADVDARIVTAGRFDPASAHRARYDYMHAQFEAAFTALAPIHVALNGGGLPA
jgi:xylulokinase